MSLSRKRKAGVNPRGWTDRPSTGTSDGRTGATGDVTRKPLYPNEVHQTSMSDLLKQLAGQGDLQQLLASLGIQGMGNMSPAQQEDWNKQLLDQILSVQLEQDKRQYNEGIRDEQRIYDTPTNQLARLMGAGISRDAAIQLLGGSGSSGGSMVTGDAAELVQGTSASQSNLNAIQGQTAIANTVINGISALCGLASFGLSVPQAVQQITMLRNRNILDGLQISALRDTNEVFSVLQSLEAPEEAFQSIASATAFLTRLASNGNEIAQSALSKVGNLRSNAAIISPMLADLYQNERRGRDYATEFTNRVRQQEADAHLTELSYDALQSDILKCAAEIEKILADTDFQRENIELCKKQAVMMEEQAKVLKKQGALLDAQRLLTMAEKLRTDAETKSISLQNTVEEAFQTGLGGVPGDKHTGLDLLTTSRLQNLYGDVKTLAKTTNEKYFDAKAAFLLGNYETMTSVNALRKLRMDSGLEYADEHKETMRFAWALDDCGLGSYYNALQGAREKETYGQFNIVVSTPEYEKLNKLMKDAEKRDKKRNR